jgi:glycosyltransferase involved in cell wall biosynthesis
LKTVIVIPTYDEAAALPALLDRILLLGADLQILVVDDDSPDGTGRLADEYAARYREVQVLHRAGKLGLGSAYRDGFTLALQHGADAIIEMDADHSHNPRHLPAFVTRLESDADVVIGSRYVSGVRVENWPFRRLLLSRLANYYVNFTTGMPDTAVSDATSGYRAYRREVVEAIDLATIRSSGYAFQIEMAYRAWRLGFRIREIPITFEEHYLTSSKISRGIVWEAIWTTPLLRVRSPRRRRAAPDLGAESAAGGGAEGHPSRVARGSLDSHSGAGDSRRSSGTILDPDRSPGPVSPESVDAPARDPESALRR